MRNSQRIELLEKQLKKLDLLQNVLAKQDERIKKLEEIILEQSRELHVHN